MEMKHGKISFHSLKALEFVNSLQVRVTKSYDLLKTALAERFSLAPDEHVLHSQFKCRSQNKDEPLEIFFQELRYIPERAVSNECHGNQSFDPISPKTLCSLSLTLMMLHIKLVKIGRLASEIFKFHLKNYERMTAPQNAGFCCNIVVSPLNSVPKKKHMSAV